MRVQDPTIQRTTGSDPVWYIRPYVDSFDKCGAPCKRQQRVYLGRCAEVNKRKAIRKKNEIMARINKSQVILQAQIPFGALLDHYLAEFVRAPQQLAEPTRRKYEVQIRRHIRPAWENHPLCEINGLAIATWLNEKGKARVVEEGDRQVLKPGLSWASRTDLRNIMSGIFSKAIDWGLWKADNPVARVSVGRRLDVRQPRKLSIEQTRALLAELLPAVRVICEAALFCALRISEVLGLQWKHIDFARGLILVRQRWYRGDLAQTKTRKSSRDVPMGSLAGALADLAPRPLDSDAFVFSVPTHPNRKKPGMCRDDRSIMQHFLRPAAKKLGIYVPGFGFHAFRREAITELGESLSPHQVQRMAGHAEANMTLHYTLADLEVQEAAIRRLQAKVRGDVVEIKRQA